MPNWVTNRLTIDGTSEKREEIFQLILKLEGDKPFFDFETLLPMPSILHTVMLGSTIINGVRVKFWIEGENGPRIPTTEELVEIEKTGAPSWYEWSCDNWGTKWNSCEFKGARQNEGIIYFDTAWSPPVPVILALAKKFPEVNFELAYLDEGWNFAGTQTFYNGALSKETDMACVETNPVFCDMCLEFKGYDPRTRNEE